MIVSLYGEDWDTPHMRTHPRVGGWQDVTLTPEELAAVPWAAAWKCAVTTTYLPAWSRRMTLRFPRTALSARFADVDTIWLYQHDGLRTFALGPLQGHDDLLRLIRSLIH